MLFIGDMQGTSIKEKMPATGIAEQIESLAKIERILINRLETYATEDKRVEFLCAIINNTAESMIREHIVSFLREENPQIVNLFPGYPDSLNQVYSTYDKKRNYVDTDNQEGVIDDKIKFNGTSVFLQRGPYFRFHTDPPEIADYLKRFAEELEIRRQKDRMFDYKLKKLEVLDYNQLEELSRFMRRNPNYLLAFAKEVIRMDASSEEFKNNEAYRDRVYKYYAFTKKILEETIKQCEGNLKETAEHLKRNLQFKGNEEIKPYYTKDHPPAQKDRRGEMILCRTQDHPSI